MQAEIISFTALVVALVSAVISYVVLRVQSEPEIVVYAAPDTRRPSLINLIIENMGNGVAREITFNTSRALPQKAFGFQNAPVPKQMQEGPLIHGIAFLHPGERRVITWGQYWGISKGLDGLPVDVTASYSSNPLLKLISRRHVTVSSIDIQSFEGTDASDENWDRKCAEQLQKIAEAITDVTELLSQTINLGDKTKN